MKKIILLIIFTFCLTGCFKGDNLENSDIITTSYPVYYLSQELYGYNSNISSIFPKGINYNDYKLSNKKIKKYSNQDLFIYNGLSKEQDIAATFVNKNKNLKIIDVSENMTFDYSQEELWLNPSNFLMLSQNLKNGFEKYIKSTTINNEIDKNYENLKVKLSELETELKNLGENGTNKALIVSKDYFKYLKKFGLNIISVEDNESLTNDTINRVKKLVEEKTIKYIYVTDEETASEDYNNIIDDLISAGAEIKTLNTITLLTTEQSDKKEDYISLMKANIELIKESIYA